LKRLKKAKSAPITVLDNRQGHFSPVIGLPGRRPAGDRRQLSLFFSTGTAEPNKSGL